MNPDHQPKLVRPKTSRFPWTLLPIDLRLKILYLLPLQELYRLQATYPEDLPQLVDTRVKELYPLYQAWIQSPIAVRNVTKYRARWQRVACQPLEFCQLDRLVAGSTELRHLSHIGELACLKVLHVDDNRLFRLPKCIINCTNLLLLDLSNNRLRSFPVEIFALKQLRHLVVSLNPIEVVPIDVCQLAQLRTLSCYACMLTELPDQLIEFVVARDEFLLNVSANRFERLYLMKLCERWPRFKRRLTHVMYE